MTLNLLICELFVASF